MQEQEKLNGDESGVFEMESTYWYKVVLLGNSGVGKTNIVKKFTTN